MNATFMPTGMAGDVRESSVTKPITNSVPPGRFPRRCFPLTGRTSVRALVIPKILCATDRRVHPARTPDRDRDRPRMGQEPPSFEARRESRARRESTETRMSRLDEKRSRHLHPRHGRIRVETGRARAESGRPPPRVRNRGQCRHIGKGPGPAERCQKRSWRHLAPMSEKRPKLTSGPPPFTPAPGPTRTPSELYFVDGEA